MRWSWLRFADLGVDDLYDALALRSQVFVVEQRCAYLDPDGVDRGSWHLLGRDAAGRLVAYVRVVDAGLKFDEPSIGRVVTAPEARGSGLGRMLMAEALRRCEGAWPGRAIRIGAQAHLERFYGDFGFAAVGEPYQEDDIPHLQMLRSAR
jgi:ElaA protein